MAAAQLPPLGKALKEARIGGKVSDRNAIREGGGRRGKAGAGRRAASAA